MSSPDRRPRGRIPAPSAAQGALGRAIRGVLVGAALAAGLAGCASVRPLYAPDAAGRPGPQAALANVKVETPETRAGMTIRNELIFGLNGGQDPRRPTHRLVVRVTEGSVPVGTEQYQRLPAATLVQLNAGFQLIESATGRVAFQGTSFGNASYDYSSQRFANARAKLDAEDRAGGVIATDIRAKITAWFATHPEASAAPAPARGAGAGPTAAEQTLNGDD